MTDLIEWGMRGGTTVPPPAPVCKQLRSRGVPARVASRVRRFAPEFAAPVAAMGADAHRRTGARRIRPYAGVVVAAHAARPMAVITAAELAAPFEDADHDNSWTSPTLAGVAR